MVCSKCRSELADDAVYCHKCGVPPVRLEESATVSDSASANLIEDIAKYDIVLVDITTDEEISEKAKMAVAYVIFEDEIKRVSGDSDPDPVIKNQKQEEATRSAYYMAQNLPATLKRSIRKKEALFFKKRLADYGVTVLLGYCPDCGGALSNLSDICSVCGQAAIELVESEEKAPVSDAAEPMLGESSSFCRECGTLSQGEADYCRKCGSQTGDPPAFTAPATVQNDNIYELTVDETPSGEKRKKIKDLVLGMVGVAIFSILTIFVVFIA